MQADDERVFRSLEKRLDAHHRSLQFNQCSPAQAILAILIAYDSFTYFKFQTAKPGDIPREQKWKQLDEGLSVAISWTLLERQPTALQHPPKGVLDDAFEFLHHAQQYVLMADMHKMVGRGLMDVEVNEEENRVRFLKRKHSRLGAADGFAENVAEGIADVQEKMDSIGRHGVEAGRILRSIAFDILDGHICLTDVGQIDRAPLSGALDMLVFEEKFSPAAEIDLGGFSVGQFQQFWKAMRRWSSAVLHCNFTAIGKGIGQFECSPVQLLSTEQLLEALTRLSEVPNDIVRTIYERLRVGKTTQCDLFLTPFIEISGSTIWSPSIILNSKAVRNMLKLMSRTPKFKPIADNIIGGRERAFLVEVGRFLSQHGYQFKIMQNLTDGSNEAEIDLLAYKSKYPKEVLIVEGKTFLSVDEINEVEAATQEMIKAQRQLRRAAQIVGSLPPQSKSNLYPFVHWNLVSEVFSLILTTEAEPNDKLIPDEIPAISFSTLKFRLRSSDLDRPRKIWHACAKRPWLSDLDDCTIEWQKFPIGSVLYEIPVVDLEAEKVSKM